MTMLDMVDIGTLTEMAAAKKTTADGLKSIALGVGAGLGTIGPGIGVGYIFGKVIESVTRQPEMREEITSIQWLGFALTEAIVFYAFIFGLIAFFLWAMTTVLAASDSGGGSFLVSPSLGLMIWTLIAFGI